MRRFARSSGRHAVRFFFDQLIFTTTSINYKNSILCQKIAKIFQPIVSKVLADMDMYR